MADKVVSVRLEAQVQGFVAGMKKARASVDDVTKAATPSKAAAFSAFADKAALAGVGIAAGIGVAVKRFADFDQAMSAVKANSGETGARLDALRAAAIKLGADSQFSATEAAQGINELAKAGVKTADILGGGLKGSLDLAAAGQIGVAEAAETAATAMTQFGLSGDKVPHIADLLTNAANKAQGGVGDMGMALKQAGLVASQMGLSIEETTAGLTAFASAGLIGSDAGTSFKSMLQRLSNPSKEASGLMADLGINAYDAQGNFVGLAGIAGQLKTSMQDLTPAQRDAAMATIFGSDAVRAAAVLYNEGAEGIQKWTKEVSEQGAAAKQAATLTDNLMGDIERLGGAFDSVLIQGGSSANSSLRTLVQGLTGVVDIVGKIPGPVLMATTAMTAFALLAPKGVLAWRRYVAQLDTLGLSLDKITAKAPRAGAALGIIGKASIVTAVASVAVGIKEWAAAAAVADPATDQLAKGLQALADGAKESADFGTIFARGMGPFKNNMEDTAGALDDFAANARAALDPRWYETATGSAGQALAVFEERAKQLDAAFAQMIAGGNVDGAKAAFDKLAAAAVAQGVPVEKLKGMFPQYAAAIDTAASAATNATGPTSGLSTETDALEQAASAADQALSDLQEAILGLGSPVAAQRAATRDYEAAIDAATASVKENGKTLDVHTEKGRENQAALDALHGAILEKVSADYEATAATKGVDAATKVATETMKKGRTSFINAATAAGMTKTEAEKLADQLGLIPDNVKINVKQSGAQQAAEDIDRAARDRYATIHVTESVISSNRQAYGRPVFAGGGAVFGAGTATSDSIDARLSNGEHVLTAAEVQKLGGQSAVYAMRDAIHKGWAPGFAGGGAVQYAPRGMFTATPSVSRSVREGDTVTLNAYGNDSVQATRAALREWELRQVARL